MPAARCPKPTATHPSPPAAPPAQRRRSWPGTDRAEPRQSGQRALLDGHHASPTPLHDAAKRTHWQRSAYQPPVPTARAGALAHSPPTSRSQRRNGHLRASRAGLTDAKGPNIKGKGHRHTSVSRRTKTRAVVRSSSWTLQNAVVLVVLQLISRELPLQKGESQREAQLHTRRVSCIPGESSIGRRRRVARWNAHRTFSS